MEYKWIIIAVILLIGIIGVIMQVGKGIVRVVIGIIVTTLALGVVSAFIYDLIKEFPSGNDNKGGGNITVEETVDVTTDENIFNFGEQKENTENEEAVLEAESEMEEIMEGVENPIDIDYSNDISGVDSFVGKISEEGEENKYRYIAPVSGKYRFEADVNAGVDVWVEIRGENDEIINYATNELTIKLEKGKTYIVAIEERNGICDYTVSIGIPNETEDVTGKKDFSGKITYREQENKYRYTAPVSGKYRFETDVSAGAEIWLEIEGENENTIDSGVNAKTIILEAGKTYILSVEERNGVCDYMMKIGVPNERIDVTGSHIFSGKITYQDQEDKYRYTAPVSGKYRFETDVNAGAEVWLAIEGENGNTIDSGVNAKTIILEAGKTYILSIEERNGVCDYTMNIGVPNPIKDITGSTYVAGNITYKDQEDKYRYIAPVDGKYTFEANCSAGAEVWLAIEGENGNTIDSGVNKKTMDLEAGKTYILSVEYRGGICSYEMFITIS